MIKVQTANLPTPPPEYTISGLTGTQFGIIVAALARTNIEEMRYDDWDVLRTQAVDNGLKHATSDFPRIFYPS